MSDNPILAALTRLEAGQTAMRVDMTSLHADMSRLRVDFLEELGSTRGVLIARLEHLQSRIDQLQEECFVAFAQGETVRRISDNTRAESHAGARGPMTAEDFRRRITALGYTQRGFADYVGANERTVRRWAEGEQDIPRWVSVMLDLMERAAAA